VQTIGSDDGLLSGVNLTYISDCSNIKIHCHE